VTKRLRNDQRAVVRRNDHSVREKKIPGNDRWFSVHADVDNDSVRHWIHQWVQEIEPGVANIHATPTINDAVTETESSNITQVRELLWTSGSPSVHFSTPGIAYYELSVRQDAETARQVRQRPDGPDCTVQVGRLDALVMDIEKQQLLTNPSRAFGELQTAVDIDQGFGGRALQRGLLLVRTQRLRTGAKNCGVFPARLIMMTNCRNGLSENRSHESTSAFPET
jgi:hypothetical protein